MQRANAVKALRNDFSKTEREERLALAASLEDGPGESLLSRQSFDPSSAPRAWPPAACAHTHKFATLSRSCNGVPGSAHAQRQWTVDGAASFCYCGVQTTRAWGSMHARRLPSAAA